MKYFIVVIFASFFFFSCGKKEPVSSAITPTNLTLNAVVNSNNSGNVNFTASATNAVMYEFDFGNGIFQNVVSGMVTYKYFASGTYTVKVVAKSSTGQTVSAVITITVSVLQTLVWSDEFNTNGLPDGNKWGYDLGGGGWGNNELQNYTNRLDNAYIANGTLKIVAKVEALNGSNYTSARLLSKSKYSFKYGKIEMSAKLPSTAGSWPAFWLLGDNINTVSWPACGEIDIMEHVANQLNKIHNTIHYPGFSGGNGVTSNTIVPTATTAFHKYTLDWNSVTMQFLIDDVLVFTIPNNTSKPFNQPFFVILNQAVGGDFGGAVSPSFTNDVFEIDYVRVYQ